MDTSSTTQQEISQGTTPAQVTEPSKTETTQPTPGTQPADKTVTTEPESWEYKGDRKEVPDNFKKYVEGLDRYVSKKDQAAAELRKKAEEYDAFVKSENYTAYQRFIAEKPKATGTPSQPQPVMTEDEAAAIAVGDTEILAKVIQREVQRNINETVGPKEAEITKKFQAMDLKEKQIQNAEMIQSFAEVHPDFWELYDNGFEDYIITSVKSGKSLEDAYKTCKEIEGKMNERLEKKRVADFEKKKAGTVVGKSIPGTPDVVYADNEDHAKRLAIELTLKGDNRHVRIKPKK